MTTRSADDFALIRDRQAEILRAEAFARRAAGCAYAGDRPRDECAVCNNPRVPCIGCVRMATPGASTADCPICWYRPAHKCPDR